jgi:uncharacterized repeat protein (TIGR03803 family)
MSPIPARCLFRRVRMLSLSAVLTLLVPSLSAHAQTYTVIHSFAGKPTDASYPNGELIQDEAGNFYGTSFVGGAYGYGTVFKMDSNGNVTILHSFDENHGQDPAAGLLSDGQGNFYGTTKQTVFRLDANNNLKNLHELDGYGGVETTSRMVTINGDLYFVAWRGGNGTGCTGGCGQILKMTKDGTETVLYNFTGGADGANPQGTFRDAAGNLYGVASYGGIGFGTVWKLDTSGVFSVLYTFTGGPDGANPWGRLIRDTNGNIHGVTWAGGDPTCDCGVVFRLDANGHETVLHKFFGENAPQPRVGLLDVGGTLYGMTALGGDLTCRPPIGCGVLYQISKTGQYTVLHRFTGTPGDGANSEIGGLTLGKDGSIYGTTWEGGTTCPEDSYGCGVIFKYTP